MSYDFAIWRRSSATKTAMLAAAYEALCEPRGHPAVDTFDTGELARAILAVFSSDPVQVPFTIDHGTADGSSCLILNCTYAEATSVRDAVLDLVLLRGLLMYDPQRQVVWGNRRPPSA